MSTELVNAASCLENVTLGQLVSLDNDQEIEVMASSRGGLAEMKIGRQSLWRRGHQVGEAG